MSNDLFLIINLKMLFLNFSIDQNNLEGLLKLRLLVLILRVSDSTDIEA